MTTTTQRKKGWWKIWVIIALVFAVIAVGIALYYFGYDYISWVGVDLVAVKMWSAASWINAGLESTAFVFVGVFACWIWFMYLRGNKTVSNTLGYTPAGQSLSSTAKSDVETTVSA
jgi:hypothetical protein